MKTTNAYIVFNMCKDSFKIPSHQLYTEDQNDLNMILLFQSLH